ncbi:uncharacterized protein M6B38_177725 [Iris pallida]|uniref:Uncharacterized protein n=1 Tax=Iris pallida TaxID=29817 RepID=A0AAX6EPK7_IRIPA|nr:uncharacterized protein M6B38_177725 [Iris pallida]
MSVVMEKVVNGQPAPMLKKGKKKQAKDELDRLKQAEKKKRRLEKALANSAAIRSELEKKKQKKKEEQQRLDEEGAAIAEAVALHVLVEEDAEDACHFMLNSNTRYNPWNHSGNIGLFMGYQSLARYSTEGHGWANHGYGSGCKLNDWEIGQSFLPGVHLRDFQSPFYERSHQGGELPAGLIAAQAVSSLKIAEDPQESLFSGQGAATVVMNRMLGGQQYG